MASATETVDLENVVVQQLVKEAVRMGLGTPLREPILAAVDESTEEGSVSDVSAGGGTVQVTEEERTDESGGALTRGLLAVAVFATLFVVAYVALRYLAGDDDED